MSGEKRTTILESALTILRDGGVLSLDSVARQAGLTKPGLMYHFPTKEALMLGVVDHVTDSYVRSLEARLGSDPTHASPSARVRAYLDWSFSDTFDAADLVVFSDPRLRRPMAQRWEEQLGAWFATPDDLSAESRAKLHAARLIADGAWLADASATFVLDPAQRAAVCAVAERLIEDVS